MTTADSSEIVPSAHAPILQPGSLMCVCGERAATHTSEDLPTAVEILTTFLDEYLTLDVFRNRGAYEIAVDILGALGIDPAALPSAILPVAP